MDSVSFCDAGELSFGNSLGGMLLTTEDHGDHSVSLWQAQVLDKTMERLQVMGS